MPGLPEESLLQLGICWEHSPGSSSSSSAGRTTPKIHILGLTRLEEFRWQSRELVHGATARAARTFLSCSPFPTSALRKKHPWNAAECTCPLPRGANSCLCFHYLIMAPKCFLVLIQTSGAASKIILSVLVDPWHV